MQDAETPQSIHDPRLYLVGQILSGILARADTKIHLIPEMIKKAFDIADEALLTHKTRPNPHG